MNSINYNNQRIKPSKVVCIGRNYAAHIEELKNEVPDQPVVFVKPNSAISNDLRSSAQEEIHYEGEISFLIIDKKLTAVGFGLDLTKRQTQSKLKEKGLPWERAKAFDGAAVFSEFIEIQGKVSGLRLELEINGQIIQQGGCGLMLNQPAELVTEVSAFMSFEDGDILMTGTPKGVGIVNRGDVFTGRIFDVGKLLVEKQWQA